MRAMLAGGLALIAAILGLGVPAPAGATDQFSAPDGRSNFVYRLWGPRYTYRLQGYDGYHTLLLGPRYHYRLRRQGIDLQLRDRDPWVARVEAHPEVLK